MDMAAAMGIEILTEEQYRALQKIETFDKKTSSWVQTPSDIRKLGGALFCDFRYGQVFVYHNGADSYYSVRGFRGGLTVQTFTDRYKLRRYFVKKQQSVFYVNGSAILKLIISM